MALKTWLNLKKFFLKPKDPSLLGYFRIAYSILMFMDLFGERGLHKLYVYEADYQDCRYPLFDFIKPLPCFLMITLHVLKVCAIIGIGIGYNFKHYIKLYVFIVTYVFLMDVTRWNNHSYLFVLLSILFSCTDANHYLSLDGKIAAGEIADDFLFGLGYWLNKKSKIKGKAVRNKHIPNYQYFLLQFQIFLLYFYAAIKKLDPDWLSGWSMTSLHKDAPFDVFRSLGFSNNFLNIYVVHLGGFFIDLTSGFLLYFDKTRIIGYLQLMSFHTMNSLLFSIGMFPYTCMATMFVFCGDDSFRKLIRDKSSCVRDLENCYYEDLLEKETQTITDKKTDKVTKQKSPLKTRNKPIYLTLIYMFIQLTLPFTHSITQGYNGWSLGLYGYSWDMMVQSFGSLCYRFSYIDPRDETNERIHLSKHFFTDKRGLDRASTSPRVLELYTRHMNRKLKEFYGYNQTDETEDFKIYADILRYVNKRPYSRPVNQKIELLSELKNWSPFKTSITNNPIIKDFDHLRQFMIDTEEKIKKQDYVTTSLFFSDRPGDTFEVYVPEEWNTSIELIEGQVTLNIASENEQQKLVKNEPIILPAGQYHTIYTFGSGPSLFHYKYSNTSHVQVVDNFIKFNEVAKQYMRDERQGCGGNITKFDLNECIYDISDFYDGDEDLDFLENERFRKTFTARYKNWRIKNFKNSRTVFQKVSDWFLEVINNKIIKKVHKKFSKIIYKTEIAFFRTASKWNIDLTKIHKKLEYDPIRHEKFYGFYVDGWWFSENYRILYEEAKEVQLKAWQEKIDQHKGNRQEKKEKSEQENKAAAEASNELPSSDQEPANISENNGESENKDAEEKEDLPKTKLSNQQKIEEQRILTKVPESLRPYVLANRESVFRILVELRTKSLIKFDSENSIDKGDDDEFEGYFF